MSEKNKRHTKKWLVSRMKSSGSKRRYLVVADYAEQRNKKKGMDPDEWPKFERMSPLVQLDDKINYGPLKRFIRKSVGKNWEAVHAEILERIPTALYDYKNAIYWFVADLTTVVHGRVWDLRAQKFLFNDTNELVFSRTHALKEFYVDPNSFILCASKQRIQTITNSTRKCNVRQNKAEQKRAKLYSKRAKKNIYVGSFQNT